MGCPGGTLYPGGQAILLHRCLFETLDIVCMLYTGSCVTELWRRITSKHTPPWTSISRPVLCVACRAVAWVSGARPIVSPSLAEDPKAASALDISNRIETHRSKVNCHIRTGWLYWNEEGVRITAAVDDIP